MTPRAEELKVRELEDAFRTQRPRPRGELAPNEGHRRFAAYAARFLAPGTRTLDIGCGNGENVELLTRGGFLVTGVDVRAPFAGAADPAAGTFVVGSGFSLPFATGAFAGVTMMHVLEHVYEPDRVLAEVHRVLAPGGLFVMAGPNLLSPVHSLATLVSCALGRGGFHPLRHKDPPPSPFGDHLIEAGWLLARNAALLVSKLLPGAPAPSYRVPDPKYVGWSGDTDSVYLCNPHEVRKMLERLGMRIEAYQGEGLTGWLGPFAAGVWLAARK
jgi:SAM-dependent methyltransferase